MPNTTQAAVELRAAHAADEPFVRYLFAETRASDFASIPGEDAAVLALVDLQFAAQAGAIAARFPDAEHEIITRDGVAVGRIATNTGPTSIRLIDIAVLPEFQGQGIGTRVLAALLDTADAARSDVTLSVWQLNERAIALYARLGFRQVEMAGGYLDMRRGATLAEAAA